MNLHTALFGVTAALKGALLTKGAATSPLAYLALGRHPRVYTYR